MGKILIIAEKSSVAYDIAKITNCIKKCNGYIVGNEYVIAWAKGHLIELCDPKEYNKSWKKWSFETLPIIPSEIQIKPISYEVDRFNLLKSLMNDPGIDSLICATDSGREGELIFRLIYQMAECKKPFQRLWISSLTDQAIANGLNNLKDGSYYDNLYQSALSRSFADWLVGINATRAYSIKYKGVKLPIGRVQTPTLGLIVCRQKEINSFKSKEYWEVTSYYESFSGKWFNPDTKETRLYTESEAKAIADKIKNQQGIIENIDTSKIEESPPLLYDLTSLQKDASKKFGLTAQETLDVVQFLYEKKHVTYPRTDSCYLSEDIADTIPERIKLLSNNLEYQKMTDYIMSLPMIPLSKRVVDNTKITDHHAIIPDLIIPKSLNDDESNIYDLIARRFLSVFYPEYQYTIKTITVDIENEKFSSRGKTINQFGWMECFYDPEENQKDITLPDVKTGDNLKVINSKATKSSTRPPSYYTDGTLVSAMENIGRNINDKDIKDALNGSGLGTSATRAAIIEKLIQNGYVQRSKGFLKATQKGMDLIEIVPPELKSAEMTGKWEQALKLIEHGKMYSNLFIDCISDFVKSIVQQAYISEKREDLYIASIENDYYKSGGGNIGYKNQRYNN